ncbi:MAG: alpha/beta fold hydrolase [Acidobacteria bacterium]|nr:alpha/beta fold hydrolase [Acidobacteriota bacterium]
MNRNPFSPGCYLRVLGSVLLVWVAGSLTVGGQGLGPVELVRLSTGEAAAFYAPQGKAKTTGLLMVHGAGTDLANFYNFPPLHLEKWGYPVLAINTRFHDNTSKFIDNPLELEALDIAAAITYLKSRPGIEIEKIVLIGHSLGGARVVFYQTQAQLPAQAPGRVAELKGAQLPPADGVVDLFGASNPAKHLIKSLDPCMAKFGRNCAELDLLQHGPPFDREYLKKLRTTQEEIYRDMVEYVKKRLKELESDKDPLTNDEAFFMDRRNLSSNPDYIDPQLTGCGENGDKDEEEVPLFFGLDAEGRAVVKRVTCKEARAGHPPRDASVEAYKAFIKSPRSTGPYTLRGFLNQHGPDTNYATVRYIGKLSVPLLILQAGWDSPVVPWFYFDNMEAARNAGLKDFEDYWIPSASHYLPATDPVSPFPEEQFTQPPNLKPAQKTAVLVADWLKRKGF